ncbi:RHS repeat-associated core domain-containing protein (plasmid) [Streptomyces sp. AHU1]|uniref:RHS repeat-associated core domain-containing protein n=1 Tax=Streptomyces sp. AHU1 TaxID=3377215 RepID=UPI00387797F0
MAGLLSTMSVVSPGQAAAAEDTTPVVPSQSLGTVPAQQAEEVGKALPKPDWPSAAEATVDLSQTAPGDPGEVTPSPSASSSQDQDATKVADVVEVAPAPEGEGTVSQLGSAHLTEDDASPSTSSSPSDSPDAAGASPAPEASATAEPQSSDSASASPSVSPSASASVEPADDPVSPDQVDVRVLDREAVAPAGGVGLGLQVTRSDGVAEPGQVQVSIDYSGFKYAYGGEFASRLRLVKVPACALETPDAEGCTSREFVPVDNDTAKGTLTATVVAEPDESGLSSQLGSGAGVSVYAVTSSSSSDQGDYRASTLSPTGSWEVATGSGAFTYSLPVQLPKPAMGSAPALAMSYNSQSVDGRTSATNNQASWVGMGWDLSVGFIERRYRGCTQDGVDIGDLCWDSPNTDKEPDGAVYVINLNGVSSQLVQDGTGTGDYHVQDDPGWRVQHLFNGHGADDEYWVISSQDGHRYYFGWGRSERTQAATASVFTVPVVGNNPGEPCFSQFPEPCTQAWRWNLDRVVDANEVESVYFYDKETNYYRSVAENVDKPRAYTSAGYLNEIQYGWASQISGSIPTGKVVLSHVGRCVERMSDSDPLRSEPGACPSISSSPSSYPDVPVDLMCDGTSADYYCEGHTYYPTFFSKDMLWDIKTYVLNTTANGWDLVQQYQTKHGLPNPDGAVGKTLWLDYVQRKTYGSGTDIVLPVINFNGIDLDNQVGDEKLNFRRIETIHGDLGATTTVTYGSPNPCSSTPYPTQSSNTKDCYWQKWTPEGASDSTTGWFKKFLVTKVTVDPTVTSNQDGAPEMTTTYDYGGGAGWRFTNDPLTKDDDETWSDWRGYQNVEVTTGTGAVKHSTVHWLYRGLDGDRTDKSDPSKTRSVSVTDGQTPPVSYTDSPWLQGKTIETSQRDDAGYSHERVFHKYWVHTTATYTGLPDARFVRETETTTSTQISTRWRDHVVQNEFDETVDAANKYGLPSRVDDQGEQGVADNRCTTFGRSYNTDLLDGSSIQRWMVVVDETRHYNTAGSGCDGRKAAGTTGANQDGFVETLYDNATSVAANHPVDGNPTELRTYASAGSTDFLRTKHDYDNAGRVVWTEDGKKNRTTTTYTPNDNWPTGGITTTTPRPNPAGLPNSLVPLTSTVWLSRFWGVPYKNEDANGKITTVTLDAAGRTTEVWKPTETGSSPSLKFSYSIPASTIGGVPDSVDGYPGVGTQTLQSGSTYLSTHTYTDALGRTRETQAPLPHSLGFYRQVAVTRYDTAGNVTGTSAVFRNPGVMGINGPASPEVKDLPSYTDLTLDWAGRTTSTHILVGNGTTATTSAYGSSSAVYHGDYTTVTPAVYGATDTYTDVYGNTSKVVEHKDSSTFTTQYTYTDTGQLKQISDWRGNNTVYTYNWAGQRLTIDDPDAGLSKTEYDENGQVSKVSSNFDPATGSAKTVLSYAYDNLGRKTSVISGADELAAWNWDDPSIPGGKGQITSSVSRDTSGNSYTTKIGSFDSRGRPKDVTVTIPANVTGLAGDYKTEFTYDAADHVTTVKYPAAGGPTGLPEETVTTGYNDFGQADSVASGLQTYVSSTVYDAYSRLTDRFYGKPATSGSGDAVTAQRSYSYQDDTGTRWLQGISTTTTANQLVIESQKDTYSYDLAGNITQLSENSGGQSSQSQCFTYDNQARLTLAYTHAGTCAGTTASDFAGTSPYQTSYSYDSLGNLQSVTDTGQTSSKTIRDYLYPGYDDTGTWTTANADQPHGVRKINHIVGGSTTSTDTFKYNYDGTMQQRIEPGATTDYTWTKLGQLSTVKTTKTGGSDLTRYVYDADGNLAVRTTPTETVAYIGGMELRNANNKISATRYYTSGGAAVAMRTTTDNTTPGGKVTYLMADNQASTQLTVDAATGTATRRRYTPFGDERSGSLPAGTSNGFLGKTEDTSTGLSLLGARAYDPNLGRFLSPDPLSIPYDPQNLSAYSYSGNDPINYSDPTGLTKQYDPGGNDYTPEESREIADSNASPTFDAGGNSNSAGGNNSGGGIGGVLTALLPQDQSPEAQERLVQAWVNYGQTRNGAGYWDAPIGDGDRTALACWGRAACSEAFRVYKETGDLAKARKIAATYCIENAQRCGVDQGAYDSMKDAAETFPIALSMGMGTAAQEMHSAFSRAVERGGCSFSPSTLVLLEDGKSKPISKVEPGDQVEVADPDTGRHRGTREVTATHINHDDDLVDVEVRDHHGHLQTLHATSRHRIWDDTAKAWEPAGLLIAGHVVKSADNSQVVIIAVIPRAGRADMYDLTVSDLHTYYVLAGATPVLVHNCNKNQGVYVFDDKSKPGHVYIGKTNNFNVRLNKHADLGRRDKDGPVICIHVCGDDTALRIREHIMKVQFEKMGFQLSSGIEGYGRNLYNKRQATQPELPFE